MKGTDTPGQKKGAAVAFYDASLNIYGARRPVDLTGQVKRIYSTGTRGQKIKGDQKMNYFEHKYTNKETRVAAAYIMNNEKAEEKTREILKHFFETYGAQAVIRAGDIAMTRILQHAAGYSFTNEKRFVPTDVKEQLLDAAIEQVDYVQLINLYLEDMYPDADEREEYESVLEFTDFNCPNDVDIDAVEAFESDMDAVAEIIDEIEWTPENIEV